MNTCLLPWSTRLDARSRLHTIYKAYGTVTGRLSGDLQQVPRDLFIRSVFGAPKGWLFVSADFSQIELRIAAHIARERRMLRAFILGQDLHSVMASTLTGKPVEDLTSEERKLAKAVNFGFLYDMGAAKFQSYAFEKFDLTISMEEAQIAREQYFHSWPGLHPWHARQRRLVNANQYVTSPIGRIRHLPDVLSGDRYVKAEAERQAINSPVQSMASDMMLFAMVKLDPQLDPSEAFLTGTLHDQIFAQMLEDKIDHYASLIKETMENLPLHKTFGCELTVPIVAEVEWGQHWAEPTGHL